MEFLANPLDSQSVIEACFSGNTKPGVELKLMKYFETFIAIFHYAIWADEAAFIPLAFLFPTSPEQLPSVLGLPAKDLGLMTKLGNTVFWTYYVFGYAANTRLCVSAVFLCFFTVLEILEGLGYCCFLPLFLSYVDNATYSRSFQTPRQPLQPKPQPSRG